MFQYWLEQFLFNIIISFPKVVLAMLTVVEIATAVHMCMQGGTCGEFS